MVKANVNAASAPMTAGPVAAMPAADAGSLVATTGSTNNPNIPAGYTRTPSGWSYPSCIHPVPKGGHVDRSGNVIGADGATAWAYQPCAYPRLSQSGAVLAAPAALRTTESKPRPMYIQPCEVSSSYDYYPWAEGTLQCSPTAGAGMWDAVESYLIVPPAPTDQSNDNLLLFYWSGLSDSLGGAETLFQVVLQWGQTTESDGYVGYTPNGPWVVSSWTIYGPDAYPSSPIDVNVGDSILVLISVADNLGDGSYYWDVWAFDTNTSGSTSNTGISGADYPITMGEAAIFEGYNVENCSQAPDNYMNVSDIQFYAGNPSWDSDEMVTGDFTRFVEPDNTSLPGMPANTCGWNVGYNTTLTTLWQ